MKNIKIIDNQIITNKKSKKGIIINQIIMLKSNSNYTCLYLENGKSYLEPITLKVYEEALNTKGFFRINRGILVNINHVISRNYQEDTLLLSNGQKAEISRRRLKLVV